MRVLVVAPLAVACLAMVPERDYGIRRSAVLMKRPDPECIRRVLETTDEIQKMHDAYFKSDATAYELIQFFYEGDGFNGIAAVTTSKEGDVTFDQQHINIYRKVVAKQARMLRQVMKKVEPRLASECGMEELKTDIKEWCHGVDCED